MVSGPPQSEASPNHSPYWSPATGIQHLGSTWPAVISPLQAHPPWSFLSWPLILIPDTSYFVAKKNPEAQVWSWRKGMVLKAGGGGCMEEEAGSRQEAGVFPCPLSRPPGDPTDILQQDTTRVAILTMKNATSDATRDRGSAHTSVWKTEARKQLGGEIPFPGSCPLNLHPLMEAQSYAKHAFMTQVLTSEKPQIPLSGRILKALT